MILYLSTGDSEMETRTVVWGLTKNRPYVPQDGWRIDYIEKNIEKSGSILVTMTYIGENSQEESRDKEIGTNRLSV